MKKSKELEAVKKFIVQGMNQERDEHAELLGGLKKRVDGFRLSEDTIKLLSDVHKNRMALYQEIYDFIQDL